MLPCRNLAASRQSRTGRHSKRHSIHFEPMEGRQLLTVVFGDFPRLVSEHVPSAAIILARSGDLNVAEQVRFTTSDGTAKAGVDYAAIDQIVTFGPGETVKTIPLTIVNDGQLDGEETVNLTLDNPPLSPGNSDYIVNDVLTIADREDVTSPTIRNERLMVTPSGAVKGVVLTFSEPMALGPVQDIRNYSLRVDKFDQYGDSSYVPITLTHAPVYDPATWTVTLRFDRPLKPSTYSITRAAYR